MLRFKRSARALLVVFVVVALVAFARTVNWGESWRAIQAVSPGLLATAAFLHVLSLVLKGVRWWVFLRPIGIPSLALALRATFAGAALNNVLIANSGEAARVVWVSRSSRESSARVLASLLLERFFETFGYVVLLAAAVSLLALPPALESLRPYALGAFVVMIALLVYLARYRAKTHDDTVLPVLPVLGRMNRLRHYMKRLLRTLTTISNGPRFAAAATLTMVVWVLQVASYHLTAMAAQFPISLVGTIAAVLACNIGFAVRATPGGVGVFQAIYAVTAVAFGMDKDAAIGVGLLIQTQQVVSTTLLALTGAVAGVRPRPMRAASPLSQ
jgi:uncharacterized protein (TIRG00374 family)